MMSHDMAKMHSQKVFAPDAAPDSDLESLRVWVWFAVMEAGGRVDITYDKFFRCQANASLRWRVDPDTLTLTIVAEGAHE